LAIKKKEINQDEFVSGCEVPVFPMGDQRSELLFNLQAIGGG
jgi:hypothetical protein